jgi:MYXO-CTERM domain-containing protein
MMRTGKIALLIVATAAFPAVSMGTTFTSDMDTNAGWTVFSDPDTAHTFGFDYSALNIPPSPNGGGSTLGLKMEANIATASTGDAVMATPTGFSASGDYTVQFDFWINANGPFPGGGGGSTEHLGGGVGYNPASGSETVRTGALLILDGEGGSARDYRMYKNNGEQFVGSGQYDIATNNNTDTDLVTWFPAVDVGALGQGGVNQTGTTQAGSGGFAWHTMLITVDGTAETVNFQIDGNSIGTLVCDGSVGATCDTSGGVQVMYQDLFSSVSDNATYSFGLIDNFSVTPEPTGLALMGLGGLALLRRRRA